VHAVPETVNTSSSVEGTAGLPAAREDTGFKTRKGAASKQARRHGDESERRVVMRESMAAPGEQEEKKGVNKDALGTSLATPSPFNRRERGEKGKEG